MRNEVPAELTLGSKASAYALDGYSASGDCSTAAILGQELSAASGVNVSAFSEFRLLDLLGFIPYFRGLVLADSHHISLCAGQVGRRSWFLYADQFPGLFLLLRTWSRYVLPKPRTRVLVWWFHLFTSLGSLRLARFLPLDPHVRRNNHIAA